jgi:Protein of unknown function (DUF3592)
MLVASFRPLNQSPPPRLEPDFPQQPKGSGLFGTAFGGLLWFASVWMLMSEFAFPVARSLGSRTWQQTTCVVDSSREGRTTSKVRGFSTETSRVVVRYRYTVDGREYSSERFDFSGGDRGADADALVTRLAAGARVPCFYDPDEPSEAVLDRFGFGGALLGFLVQMHAAVGMALYRDGLRSLEKSKPRPPLRKLFNAGVGLTLLGLLLGFGLSPLAGAPLWAWLSMCSLPVALWKFDRLVESRQAHLEPWA